VFGVVAALQVGFIVGCVLRATLTSRPSVDHRIALPT
jgi:hypothetical protein